MGDRHYILNEQGEPVVCEDIKEWAEWYEKGERVVWVTMVGDVKVSTVFLGLDHNWYGSGEPLLYETMVFASSDDHPLQNECERYSNVDDALLGHIAMIELVKEAALDE